MRNKDNRSQVRADPAEMSFDFVPASQPSLGSGMSNLTPDTLQRPDEATPLSLDLNSANVTTNSVSAANAILADFATKHKKSTLAGLLFLVFLMFSWTFLLGRQGANGQLQHEDENLLELLVRDDEILSNMTITENGLHHDVLLLLEHINEKDAILSNMRNEKVELVEKVAHLTEENRWLKDENDKIMEIMDSAETVTVQKRQPKCNCSTRWMSSEVTCLSE